MNHCFHYFGQNLFWFILSLYYYYVRDTFYFKDGVTWDPSIRGICVIYTDNDDDGVINYSELVDSADMIEEYCFEACWGALITNCQHTTEGICKYNLEIPEKKIELPNKDPINIESQRYDCLIANTGTNQYLHLCSIVFVLS